MKGEIIVNEQDIPAAAGSLDRTTRLRIEEFLRRDMSLTAKQVANHFRLPASAEPEIAGIMAGTGNYRPAPRDLAMLTAEIRQAYLVVDAAIPFPEEIRFVRGVMEDGLDDPRIASITQARDQAFGWALSELVDGTYSAPRDQIEALMRGMIPVPETDGRP